jgi:hypothetical protein
LVSQHMDTLDHKHFVGCLDVDYTLDAEKVFRTLLRSRYLSRNI